MSTNQIFDLSEIERINKLNTIQKSIESEIYVMNTLNEKMNLNLKRVSAIPGSMDLYDEITKVRVEVKMKALEKKYVMDEKFKRDMLLNKNENMYIYVNLLHNGVSFQHDNILFIYNDFNECFLKHVMVDLKLRISPSKYKRNLFVDNSFQNNEIDEIIKHLNSAIDILKSKNKNDNQNVCDEDDEEIEIENKNIIDMNEDDDCEIIMNEYSKRVAYNNKIDIETYKTVMDYIVQFPFDEKKYIHQKIIEEYIVNNVQRFVNREIGKMTMKTELKLKTFTKGSDELENHNKLMNYYFIDKKDNITSKRYLELRVPNIKLKRVIVKEINDVIEKRNEYVKYINTQELEPIEMKKITERGGIPILKLGYITILRIFKTWVISNPGVSIQSSDNYTVNGNVKINLKSLLYEINTNPYYYGLKEKINEIYNSNDFYSIKSEETIINDLCEIIIDSTKNKINFSNVNIHTYYGKTINLHSLLYKCKMESECQRKPLFIIVGDKLSVIKEKIKPYIYEIQKYNLSIKKYNDSKSEDSLKNILYFV